MKNLFSGESNQASFPATAGDADGASEVVAGLSRGKYLIHAHLGTGASLQMYQSFHTDKPYNWVPIGDPLAESNQVPIVLNESNVYLFQLTHNGAPEDSEVYLVRAPATLSFSNEAQLGVG